MTQKKRLPSQFKIPFYDHSEHLEALARDSLDDDGELRLPLAADWAETPMDAMRRGFLRDVWVGEKEHGISNAGPICVQFEWMCETLDGGGYGAPEWRVTKMYTTVAKVPRKKQAVKTKGLIASPAVIDLARKLGVELSDVKATGRGGRILESDVSKHAKKLGEAA